MEIQKKAVSLHPQSREKATKQNKNGALVQLVRIHACHAWGHGFESGSRKLDKSSNQIVTKKKNGNFGYDFVDMSLICRCLRSILSTRRNLKS